MIFGSYFLNFFVISVQISVTHEYYLLLYSLMPCSKT